MSYIPDCRNDENYNEKYLKRNDKEFVAGYDWCAEEAVDNFFDNLDVYFDDDSYLMHILSERLPEDMQDEETVEWTFGSREEETRKIETYSDLFRAKLLEWIETQRDELITSMIDNMDEDEYREIKEKVNGQSEAED